MCHWREPYYCHPRVYQGLPNQLFHNNGNGTFTDVSEASGIRRSIGKGMGIAFGDFNGDNRIDVFVANDSLPNFLFENQGNGKFREVGVETGVAYLSRGTPVAGMGADFRDFDDDGFEDIAADAMYFDTFPLFRNRGKPSMFSDETESSGVAQATHQLTGWGMGLFDFDNDGHKDLFFATSHFPGSDPFVHARRDCQSRAAQQRQPVLRRCFRTGRTGLPADGALPGAAFADLRQRWPRGRRRIRHQWPGEAVPQCFAGRRPLDCHPPRRHEEQPAGPRRQGSNHFTKRSIQI